MKTIPDDLISVTMTITMNDVVKAGHCASGARRWFHDHGLDFHDFMKNGIPADLFISNGDALSEQVVRHTLKRREKDSG